ncbi:unnamed protein product [Didymodactylos carnosus]|uniref:Uncharacterized protein n=1 Tax=Didymodactylos carnosus TaxID=1234261 RepID=A0A815ZFD3_9BILA|nr:unnamed protein product [Didymodactylos carnosus]CAF1582542.1 unnamed protein product [Didymodactylos carnosus]CAF4103663.1 unnamed protein product [Didymodactylos carnosus]CAF4450666.1 unnamed protein product [Didymodactylos carnosus]
MFLLKIPRTSHAKEGMLDKCRDYYRGNKQQLRNIDEFEHAYEPTKAIQWYTADMFIYKIVNKSLRTEDIDLLYLFRFYIIDLCQMLEQEYKVLQEFQNVTTFTLYRGLKMTSVDIENLNKNVGNLISTNGSTTRDINVAYMYADVGAKTNNEKIPTLFKINVNIQSQTNILANIGGISKFSDEAEVLFDLGSTFKINSVNYDKIERFWAVEMITTDEGEQITNEYITNTKSKALGSTTILTFGQLLANMDEPRKAQQYGENLLVNNTEFAVGIHHFLGLVYPLTKDYSKALDHLVHARNLFMNAVPPNFEFAAHVIPALIISTALKSSTNEV